MSAQVVIFENIPLVVFETPFMHFKCIKKKNGKKYMFIVSLGILFKNHILVAQEKYLLQ